MAKFEITEESKSALKDAAKKAASLNVNIDRLASSADASVAFQNGDQVTVPAQVCQVIAMQEPKTGWAEGDTKGYIAFAATLTRDGVETDIRLSARQLFTPTVASADDIKEQPREVTLNGRKRTVYVCSAPLKMHKRFGEHGSVTLVDGVPVVNRELSFTIETVDFLQSVYANKQQKKDAGLDEDVYLYAKRENVGVSKGIFE